MILVAIVVAEVLFWILLLGGLFTRYALRAPRIGAGLLIATPVVDFVLLVLTYVDLSTGESANFAHGLSALYIGYSIAVGPTIIRTLDKRFARRFGESEESDSKGSDPETDGYEKAMSTWKRVCMASLISVILLCAGILVTGLQDAFWLIYWVVVAVFIVVLWWFIGPYREKKKTTKGSLATVNSTFSKDSKEAGSGETTEE
ncbi:hypothetical protein [Corynebacterium timonense]|uniref:hypothetical protein n=1 Tax=Corynebacterium timonense TaxID=441500 RepID=UPI001E5E0317|nr:hypothetical protein [Corynebacterium timonense]